VPLLTPRGARRAYLAGYRAARAEIPRLKALLAGDEAAA
jgi:hypothetical protein